MTLAALALAALALGCTCLVLGLGYAHRDRWGVEAVGAIPAGAGAYRAASAPVHRHKGLPLTVGLTAGTGWAWAALTLFGFAPAGMLLAAIMVEQAAWFSVPLALVCLSGFALAVALVVVGVQLVRRRETAALSARHVACWSAVHHGAVILVMMLASLAERQLVVLLLAAIPCLMGAAHAALLWKAGAVVEQDP